MKIIDKIKERETLTPTENQIAEYIRSHPGDVVNMNLDELAEAIYVSKSTIIRFCKKIGFHGHKELCVELARELHAFEADDIELDVSMPFAKGESIQTTARKMMALNYKAIADTYQGLDYDILLTIARSIRDRRKVALYALDENYLEAMDFSARLQSLGYQCNIANFPGMTIQCALSHREDTAALFISYSGRESSLLAGARILNERRIPFFMITGPISSTLRKLSSQTVEVSFYEPFPKASAIGSRAGISLLMDIRYAMIFNMDFDKNMAIMNANSEYRRRLSEQGEKNGGI